MTNNRRNQNILDLNAKSALEDFKNSSDQEKMNRLNIRPDWFEQLEHPSEAVMIYFIRSPFFRIMHPSNLKYFLSSPNIILTIKVFKELLKQCPGDSDLIKSHPNYKGMAQIIKEAIEEAKDE